MDAENQGVESVRNQRVGRAEGQSRLSLNFKKVQGQPVREGTLFLGPPGAADNHGRTAESLGADMGKESISVKTESLLFGKSKSCTGWSLRARNRIKECCEPWAGGKCWGNAAWPQMCREGVCTGKDGGPPAPGRDGLSAGSLTPAVTHCLGKSRA